MSASPRFKFSRKLDTLGPIGARGIHVEFRHRRTLWVLGRSYSIGPWRNRNGDTLKSIVHAYAKESL